MEFVRRRVFQFLSLFCLFLSLVLSRQNSSFLLSCSYPPLHLLCFFFFFNSLLKTNFLQLSHSWIPFFLTPLRTPPSSLSNAQIIIWSSSPLAIHPFFLFCYVFLLFQVSTCSTAPTTTMAHVHCYASHAGSPGSHPPHSNNMLPAPPGFEKKKTLGSRGV